MSSQWADQPYPLISTLPFSKDSSHAACYVATEMALAHNGILRGLNSIYLQATHLPHNDLVTIRDFLTYCQCWSESMHHHHDAEEEIFFPSIEQISNVPGIMERNKEQHRAFTPGFDRFQEYARSCLPKDYDGQKLRSLIDDFAEPLTRHLRDEIETLRALDAYDSERIRQAYKRLEKVLMATDNYRIAPLVFGTADRSFEGDIVELGDSIRAQFGGIAENWLSKVKAQRLNCTPHVLRFSKVKWPSERRAYDLEENEHGTAPPGGATL